MPVNIDNVDEMKLEHREQLNKKYWQGLIISILVLSFVVRFYGIAFELPFIYDEDESRRVDQAFSMIVRGDPNPRWFGHPASTLLYMLAFVQLIIFFVGRLLGFFPNFEAFRDLYYFDPTIFYISGRFLLIIFGIACVFLTYLIGQKLFNRTVGIISAFLMAISPLHIKYSKVIRSDVLMLLFILIAFWYCLKILEEEKLKNYIWAGFFTGLATVTKYPAILIGLTIPLAHFYRENGQVKEIKKLVFSGLSCIGGAFIMSPFLFINFSVALRNIRHEGRGRNVGANGEDLISNMLWYWNNTLTDNFTFWGLILLGFGIYLFMFFPQEKK